MATDKSKAENPADKNEEVRAPNPLWQSATVSTDGNGPRVEDVSPIFAQARADAFNEPVVADENPETPDLNEAADKAQAEADAKADGAVPSIDAAKESAAQQPQVPGGKKLNDDNKDDSKK